MNNGVQRSKAGAQQIAALRARVSATASGDRELDAQICAALRILPSDAPGWLVKWTGPIEARGHRVAAINDAGEVASWWASWMVTEVLGSASALADRLGYRWSVGTLDGSPVASVAFDDRITPPTKGKTPALALLSAILDASARSYATARAAAYRTGLTLHIHDGAEHEFDLVIRYEVSAGSAESGQFGRPEDYDPGSPDELHIASARAFRVDKTEAVEIGQFALTMARSDEALHEAILDAWRDDAAAARDAHLEAVADERRLGR